MTTPEPREELEQLCDGCGKPLVDRFPRYELWAHREEDYGDGYGTDTYDFHGPECIGLWLAGGCKMIGGTVSSPAPPREEGGGG